MTFLAENTPSVKDWSHQPAAADMVRDAFRQRKRRVILVLPTGTGKTRTATDYIVAPAIAKGRRLLWLAHRRELVGQACATLAARGIACGAVAASCPWPANPDAPVQVASIQTLVAREARPACDLIVWDECHHANEGAEEWRGILDAYPETPIVGLTATPETGSGAALAPPFDGMVVGITVRQATMRGILVPCEIARPAKMLRKGNIAQHPVDAYFGTYESSLTQGAKYSPNGTQAILFARSVDEAVGYAAQFNARGIRAAVIEAQTPKAEREAALDAYRSGAVRVLCNVYVLTEGTDLPMAETCILARGASSQGIFIQMVGRVLRALEGKTRAILIDLRGVSHVHGMPEDERLFSLEGRGITLAQKECLCPVCGAIREPGMGCLRCGWEPDERDSGSTRITNDPLVKYARKIAEGPAQRRQTLKRWICAYVAEGRNPRSVFYKWKAVYGVALSSRDYVHAMMATDQGRRIG